MINVLIADDQKFVRKTLESYLELESDLKVVGFAENGEAAIHQVKELRPDIVLMDIEMPIMDGFAATKTITERFANTKVLMLSSYDRARDVALAVKLGARGYWLKNTTAKELIDSIRDVHEGYFQLASELVEKHFDSTEIYSKSERNSKPNNKIDIVDTAIVKIEQKTNLYKATTPKSLNKTVENIVKQEMILRREKDTHLQFKLDRLKHQLNQLEKIINLVIKVQFACNLVLIAAVVVLSYFVVINL